MEIAADVAHDDLRRGSEVVALLQHIPDSPADGLLVDLIVQQIAIGQYLIQGALDLPHVGGDVLGDVVGDLVGQLHAQHGRLVLHDGEPRLKIRRRHVHHQAPLEPGPQAVLQLGDLLGRAVRGQHDLPPGLIQRVEGMEELLLGLYLAGNELYIVHQQYVGLAVFLPELRVAVFPDGGDQLVGEVVALDVYDPGLRPLLPQGVGDGVQQMGLAQPGITIDKQRVVVLAGLLRHRLGRGEGQLVLGPHHVGLKGERLRLRQVAGPVRCHAVIGRQLLVVQDLHLQISGEQVPQRRFDVGQEPGFDGVLLECVAAVQHEGGILHRHHRHLVEPGVDGGLGQLAAQAFQHAVPQVLHGIQSKSSPFGGM